MAYLFIDTTSNLKIGILSHECRWIDIQSLQEKKPSEVIHKIIYESLLAHDLSLDKVDKVITCAGPGSYTGMRLSEGIVQVMELSGIPSVSFLHFDLPIFLGEEKFVWIASAFKGEYFIYEYNHGNIQKHFVSKDLLSDELKKFSDYKFYALEPDTNLPGISTFTSHEIVNNPEKYMLKVLEKNQRNPAYYYRTVDEEFKIK